MAGRGYAVFDTVIGRCGIAWGDSGIVAVQLPQAREIETRRRMLRQYPDARELRPSLNAEIAIEAMAALRRGACGRPGDRAKSLCHPGALSSRACRRGRDGWLFHEWRDGLQAPAAVARRRAGQKRPDAVRRAAFGC